MPTSLILYETQIGRDNWLKSLKNNCVIQLVNGTDLKALYLMLKYNKIFNVLRSCLEIVHKLCL